MKELEENGWYTLCQELACNFLECMGPYEAYGLENIPRTGAFLLACNHNSFLDPLIAGCLLPRQIYFFARKTLFDSPCWRWLLSRLRTIPIDREGGSDITAFKHVFATLRAGNGLLVFPEGTRSSEGTLQKARRGVGLIACRTQVPIVPTRIFGSYGTWGRHHKFLTLDSPLSVVYGKPIFPGDYDPGKMHPDRFQKVADEIMKAIGQLQFDCPK